MKEITPPLLDAETASLVAELTAGEALEHDGTKTLAWRAARVIERQHAQMMAAIALTYEGHGSRAESGCGCIKCRIRHVLRGHTIDPDPVTVMRNAK